LVIVSSGVAARRMSTWDFVEAVDLATTGDELIEPWYELVASDRPPAESLIEPRACGTDPAIAPAGATSAVLSQPLSASIVTTADQTVECFMREFLLIPHRRAE
jgi:hypothetical protein